MGGKSRKSGGVSKKLIDALKSGKYSEIKKCVNLPKDEKEKKSQPLFRFDEEKGGDP